MDQLIGSLEGKLSGLREAEQASQDPSTSIPKQQEILTTEMKKFQDNVLQLSKACLDDIGSFITAYDQMANDINQIEGSMKIMKEKSGNQALIEGFEPPPCEDFPEKETHIPIDNSSPIQLPTSDYVLNFSALDQIGQKVEDVAKRIEGMPLIREIPPNQVNPPLWSRCEDYFVESKSTRATYDPNKSTFVEIYGIEPSLYPTDKMSQRSVTQSQLDQME